MPTFYPLVVSNMPLMVRVSVMSHRGFEDQ